MVIIMDMESGSYLHQESGCEQMPQTSFAKLHAPAAWTEDCRQAELQQPACYPQLQLGLQTTA